MVHKWDGLLAEVNLFSRLCGVTVQCHSQLANHNYDLGLETSTEINKKAQLSLTNPRDACEKFARFT